MAAEVLDVDHDDKMSVEFISQPQLIAPEEHVVAIDEPKKD